MEEVKQLQALTTRLADALSADVSSDVPALLKIVQDQKYLSRLFYNITTRLSHKQLPVKPEDVDCTASLIGDWKPKKVLKDGVAIYENKGGFAILKSTQNADEVKLGTLAGEAGVGPKIYESVVCGDTTYFMMEYLPGDTLRKTFLRDINYVRDFLTLYHTLLFKLRIYHHDLHPDNVFVDMKGRVYIIDYGDARIATDLFRVALDDLGLAIGGLLNVNNEDEELTLSLEEATNAFLSISKLVYAWMVQNFPDRIEEIPRNWFGTFTNRIDLKRADVVAYFREGESKCLTEVLGEHFIGKPAHYTPEVATYYLVHPEMKLRDRILKITVLEGKQFSDEGYYAEVAGDLGIGPKVYNHDVCDGRVYIVSDTKEPLRSWARNLDDPAYAAAYYYSAIVLYANLVAAQNIYQNNLTVNTIGVDQGRLYLIDYGQAEQMKLNNAELLENLRVQMRNLLQSHLDRKQGGEPRPIAEEAFRKATKEMFGESFELF